MDSSSSAEESEIVDPGLVEIALEKNNTVTILLANVANVDGHYPCDKDGCSTNMFVWLTPIICIGSFALAFIIIVQLIYCYMKERRKKNDAALQIQRLSVLHQRQCSISTISGLPPPRYSQIFDQQDGASIFEEAPPDYETMQPNLVKTLSNGSGTLSRVSSIASNKHWPSTIETVIGETKRCQDNEEGEEKGLITTIAGNKEISDKSNSMTMESSSPLTAEVTAVKN